MAAAALGLVSPTAKHTPAGHDPFSQTLTPVQIPRPRDTAPIVSLPPPVTQRPSEESTSGGPAEGSRQHAGTGNTTYKVNQAHIDQDKKRKASYKIPRYTRRYQSRSEPFSKP